MEKHPHYVVKTLSRLSDGTVLVKQMSQSEEALAKGDGGIYFTHPDGRPVGAATARYMIDNGLVEPLGDGLFVDASSQMYRRA